MKFKLLLLVTVVILLLIPKVNFGQVISLGPDASKFVIYTSSGAVGDNASAHSHITGDVGTLTPGPITGFGNVDGIMHPGVDPSTTACEIDLQTTIALINSNPATLVGPLSLGSGATLTPGIYSIPGNATLTLDLILDGQGDPNAEFVFKVAGTFSTNTLSRVRLINSAMACHVYWKVDGSVTMASLTTMRGNIISGGLIQMGSGDSLEGRAFSTPAGAITIDGITAYMPIGCGSPVLTGPPAPDLASLYCYTIFSSIGALDGNLSSTSIGDVGNAGGGSVTGWTAGNVTGTLHPTGDPSTMLAATDLTNVYNTLNAMIPDIELIYSVEFGRNLVLTPHVYLLNSGGAFGPATLTDSLYLDAQGNSDAVFVFKIIGGGLTTSVSSRVKLINGTQAKNVFWMVDGAVEISDNSIFRGNIVVSAGAINLRYVGVELEGRALSINGAITTAGLAAAMTPGCGITSPPIIITEPTNQTVCLGDSAGFSVTATGTGLTYQWRIGNVDLIDGGNISGATTATLSINPVSIGDIALDYNVVVTGTDPPSDTSIYVSLSINVLSNITTEPLNQTACLGDSISFIVVANGTGLTYQWRLGLVNLINSANISGVTSDTLTINPVNITDAALNYNVIVSGSCSSDTSLNTSLSIGAGIIIATQPMNQTICEGDSVSFVVNATGAGLTYQWRKGIANIPGETNDTLTINPAGISDAALDYNVIISGSCSLNDTSVYVSLTIGSAIIVATQPISQSVCVGDSVSFTVNATGAGLTYQWRIGTVDILGATNDTLTINPAGISDIAFDYNVIISGSCSPNDTSNNVSLSIGAGIIIATQPMNQTICEGDSVSFIVNATGAGLTYQWRIGTVNIIGATNDTLTINPAGIADAALDYNVIISGSCSPNDTSNYVSLSIGTGIIIATQPMNQTICEGDSVSFIVNATGPGLSYQWRIGTVNILGATNDTLTINPAGITDVAFDYNVIISGSCSPNDTSIYVSLTVGSSIILATQPISQSACVGDSVSFVVNATGAGLTYQWRIGTVNILGATNDTLTINPAGIADIAFDYNVIISGDCSPNDTSVYVSLTVNETPVAIASSNSPVCVGSPVNFSSTTITGGAYLWTGTNGYSSTEQNPVILAATATDDGIYTLIITANGCTSLPASIKITIENCLGVEFNIPEGFSPNGDGINDLFVIRGIDQYPSNTFMIFNRWGDKLFEASPYLNNWDGKTSMGLRVGKDELPIGTYFYVLDLGDGSDIYKGTIYLNR